jgi:glycosyltransferase involved in cell wall biosynthesis
MIDVCICTHNPRIDTLKKVIASIANQSEKLQIRVLLIDNASIPALDKTILSLLTQEGIKAKVIYEPIPGLQQARLAAIKNSKEDWVLWVDDDNELDIDYVRSGLLFIKEHPEVGCFSGKLLLPNYVKHAKWINSFLPYVGIRDLGETEIISKADYWTPAEPPGAGVFTNKKILNRYFNRSITERDFFKLGRTGSGGLASCDDSLMMRGAFLDNLSCAYVPGLSLIHHIDTKKRFKFKYLLKLMYAYGSSHVLLESLLTDSQIATPIHYSSRKFFLKLLLEAAKGLTGRPTVFSLGMMAYHLGSRAEYIRQNANKQGA